MSIILSSFRVRPAPADQPDVQDVYGTAEYFGHGLILADDPEVVCVTMFSEHRAGERQEVVRLYLPRSRFDLSMERLTRHWATQAGGVQ